MYVRLRLRTLTAQDTLEVSLFTLKLIRSGDSYNITDNVSFGFELRL